MKPFYFSIKITFQNITVSLNKKIAKKIRCSK